MDDWRRFGDDVQASAPGILASGVVPGPPEGPFVAGRRYPLAVDVDGGTGAVSYAALELYPDMAPGWWCVAIRFALGDGGWEQLDADDNSTTQRPFERPVEAGNSTLTWLDWHSNCALAGIGDPQRYRHMFFGIAPTSTARLTVSDETGRERDLAITPWCGAYVAGVEGSFSRLAGYDHNGEPLGSFACRDEPTPAPDFGLPPGWERVEGFGNDGYEPIVHRQIVPPTDD
jgi:hypothetical protein